MKQTLHSFYQSKTHRIGGKDLELSKRVLGEKCTFSNPFNSFFNMTNWEKIKQNSEPTSPRLDAQAQKDKTDKSVVVKMLKNKKPIPQTYKFHTDLYKHHQVVYSNDLDPEDE